MRSQSFLRSVLLSISLSSFGFPAVLTSVVSAQTQDAVIALQRGFRTGYSDGYMSGYRDTIDNLAKNYSRHDDYFKADRAYNKEYGASDVYRDGYQQGFESGYETGYARRSFESTLPTGLKFRGAVVVDRPDPVATPTIGDSSQTTNPTEPAVNTEPAANIGQKVAYQPNSNPIMVIPRHTELIIELQEDLNTELCREGEKFTAKIVSPSEIAGATIEGRIAKILKPGRIKRRSELQLSFDRIILEDNRWSNFNATLTEVMAVKGDNVKRLDTEGTAVGQSSLKSDAVKVGGSTGAGIVVGAAIAGPAGAAVGAGMGAAFGVGAIVIERGKHIRLHRNQQLRIKTAYETEIR